MWWIDWRLCLDLDGDYSSASFGWWLSDPKPLTALHLVLDAASPDPKGGAK